MIGKYVKYSCSREEKIKDGAEVQGTEDGLNCQLREIAIGDRISEFN